MKKRYFEISIPRHGYYIYFKSTIKGKPTKREILTWAFDHKKITKEELPLAREIVEITKKQYDDVMNS